MTSRRQPKEVTVEDLGRRIDEVLAAKGLKRLVHHFFVEDLSSSFAGHDFDTLGDNPRNNVVIDDLLAVSLLDVRMKPPAVRRLLAGEADDLLSAVPANRVLWKATRRDLDAADELYRLLDELPGVGRTKASKLLARKRPQLMPIRDSVIERVLDLPSGGWWSQLGTVLEDDKRRERIVHLDPGLPGYHPSTLRLLDVAMWMVGSGARSAKDARESVGLKWDPLW